MVVAHTPETTNPVSTICEIVKIPGISTLAPWLIGHQDDPTNPASWADFDDIYDYHFGLEDLIPTRLDLDRFQRFMTPHY